MSEVTVAVSVSYTVHTVICHGLLRHLGEKHM